MKANIQIISEIVCQKLCLLGAFELGALNAQIPYISTVYPDS